MITKINQETAKTIISTYQPLGLFYLIEDGLYVGIDNSTGHAWVEDFPSLRQCKDWLRNPS